MKKIYVYALSLQIVLMASAALSQQTVMQGQGMPPGDNVIGKVTAATKDTITVTPMTGGDPVTVKVGGDTRVIKDRQMAGIGDIKIGDTVAARGPLKGQSMDALFVVIVDPSMIQQMIAGRPGNGPMSQFKPEDLGKKYIVGEVKAINETKLTIARPDNQTQEIEVDENTSFKKGKESVTLADITVGEFVRGTGEIKNGVFVPKELNVGRPPMRQIRIGGPGGNPPGGNPQDQKKPDDQKAPDAPKPPPDPPKY